MFSEFTSKKKGHAVENYQVSSVYVLVGNVIDNYQVVPQRNVVYTETLKLVDLMNLKNNSATVDYIFYRVLISEILFILNFLIVLTITKLQFFF